MKSRLYLIFPLDRGRVRVGDHPDKIQPVLSLSKDALLFPSPGKGERMGVIYSVRPEQEPVLSLSKDVLIVIASGTNECKRSNHFFFRFISLSPMWERVYIKIKSVIPESLYRESHLFSLSFRAAKQRGNLISFFQSPDM